MHFAYADPPYPGMARRYYQSEEVDHPQLIEGLSRQFPDGWALSTAASTLQQVLAICPAGVRVACWVKGPRQSVSYFPRSAWEPLIVYRGRARLIGVDEYSCDVLKWGGRQHSHPNAVIGMKPAAFAEWMFGQLGAQQDDQLDDLFPGSGAISRAWSLHQGVARAGRDAPRGAMGTDATLHLEADATLHLEADATDASSAPSDRYEPIPGIS